MWKIWSGIFGIWRLRWGFWRRIKEKKKRQGDISINWIRKYLMVSRVEIIVFIIYNPGQFLWAVWGKREKFRIEKESVFRGVDYSTNFYGKPWKSMAFRCLTKKLTVNKCCEIYNYDWFLNTCDCKSAKWLR